MNGKRCLVTGANSGIGKALSLALADRGAEVIMVCRDRHRGETALNEIKSRTQNSRLELLLVDLSSQRSIRNGAEEFRKKYRRLDVLINNAGALFFERSMTEEGIESTFAVNYLAPFLLTSLLLDVLKSSSPSRIINVSSESQKKAFIDFGDLMGENKYNPMAAYSQSKLAVILFTYELARRLAGTGVTVNSYYPSAAVRTNLGKADKGLFRLSFVLMSVLLSPLLISAEKAARTGLYLAASKRAEKITGKCYMQNRQGTKASLVNKSYEREISARLWEISKELAGLNKSLV